MKLLKELATLREGAMKEKMVDMIELAIKQVDTTNLSYDEAIAKIIAKLFAMDDHDLFTGWHHEDLRDMIEPYLDEEDFVKEGVFKSIKRGLKGWGMFDKDGPKELVKRNKAHDLETAKLLRMSLDNAPVGSPAALQRKVLDRRLKEDEAEDAAEEPKVIAKADEFRVELDADEQVSLIDGEGTVRVSMPLVIWKQLCR